MASLGEPATDIGNAEERGSKVTPTTKDMASLGEPTTDIGNVEEGGSKAVPTTKDMASLGEPATDIGNSEKGGSKAVPTMEDMASLGEPATNIGNANERRVQSSANYGGYGILRGASHQYVQSLGWRARCSDIHRDNPIKFRRKYCR
eukprot:8304398-Ditylum_brightwellii.AAC.1